MWLFVFTYDYVCVCMRACVGVYLFVKDVETENYKMSIFKCEIISKKIRLIRGSAGRSQWFRISRHPIKAMKNKQENFLNKRSVEPSR